MIRIITLFSLFIAFSLTAVAGKLSGRITDDEGAPLAFASILVKGTSIGTSANAEGYYALNLPEGNYTIQAQYIGYRQSIFQVNIKGAEEVRHNFALEVQGYELKDIVVKSGGEDPAYRIIRNAIKKRSYHLKQMQSFQTSIYLKGVFRNRNTPDRVMGVKLKDKDKKEMNSDMGLDSAGKGVIYLSEMAADYYTQGNKSKLIINSVRESGDPNGVGLGNVPPVVNFYENNVKVLIVNDANQQGFVSPIASSALNSYTYKLMGNFTENGQTIYKIKVTPKRNFERCFTGDLYIAEDDWAIHSVQMLLTKKEGLDLLDTIRTEQQYIALAKDLWVIKSQVFYPTITLFGFDISGNFVTIYDNQKVNQPIPDSIFNKKITVSYLHDANKRDTAYWKGLRPMKLEMDEERNYTYRDSMHLVETDPVLLDSLRRKANKVKASEVLYAGVGFTSKASRTRTNISPILFDVNFNTIEGLNYSPTISVRHRIDTGKILSSTANLRYGFGNTHFNAKGLVRYTASRRSLTANNWSLAASGGKYISQLNPEQPVDEWLNTYASLFQQINHFKIYERWLAGLQFRRNHGNGLSWQLSAQYEKRMPLYNTSGYSFVKEKPIDPYTDNLPASFSANPLTLQEAFIVKGMVSFQPGVRYTEYPDRKVMYGSDAPVFTLNYQKGIPSVLNSVTNYDKWQLQIRDKVNLRRMGALEYNIAAGGFLNDKRVAIPDMKHLFGNQYLVAAPFLQSFQLAPYYLYSNTDKLYGELHMEYYLKGLLTNKIPLLRQAHWYFVLGNNTFYSGQNKYYTEAFIGLDNFGFKVFRMFRVDYIRGWDSYSQAYSGFRIGIKTGAVLSEKNKDALEF